MKWTDYEAAKRYAADFRDHKGDDGLGLVTTFIRWLDQLVGCGGQLDDALLTWREDGYLSQDEASALTKAADWLTRTTPFDADDPLASITGYLTSPRFRAALVENGLAAAWATAVRSAFSRALLTGAALTDAEQAEAFELYRWAEQEAQRVAEKRDRLAQLQREIDALQKELDGE